MRSFESMLETLKARSLLQNRVVLGEPWGVSFPGAPGVIRFHFLEHGEGWLALDGGAPMRLETGDLVLVVSEKRHSVQDTSFSPALDVCELVERSQILCRTGITVQFGGGGPVTSVISGKFVLEEGFNHPLSRLLPPLIHLRSSAGETEHIRATLNLLSVESMEAKAGVRTILDRMCDVLLVQSLRQWMEGSEGLLPQAVRDPGIDTALDLMHREPERGWTLGLLAKSSAMSRSSFADRFRRLVGETPMDYLVRWRMHLASKMLKDGRLTTSAVAEKVGYESEASFSKAFKREIGDAPGSFRRRWADAGAVPALSHGPG